MRLFECQACGHPLYFENSLCESCGRHLGFMSAAMTMTALEQSGEVVGRLWLTRFLIISSVLIWISTGAIGLFRPTADRPFAPRAGTTAQYQIYLNSIILPCGVASKSQNDDFLQPIAAKTSPHRQNSRPQRSCVRLSRAHQQTGTDGPSGRRDHDQSQRGG